MMFLSRPVMLAAVTLSVVGLLGVGLIDRAAVKENGAGMRTMASRIYPYNQYPDYEA